MYCYYQDQHTYPGGVRFVPPVAIGVCHGCGVAVCAEHSQKASYKGAPLLCHECASISLADHQPVTKVNEVHRLIHHN